MDAAYAQDAITGSGAVGIVQDAIAQNARLADLFGLGVVLAIIITIAFIGLVIGIVVFVLRLTKVIDGSINAQTSAILAHDVRAIEAVKSLAQANEYQRQEHKEIIELIRDIRRAAV